MILVQGFEKRFYLSSFSAFIANLGFDISAFVDTMPQGVSSLYGIGAPVGTSNPLEDQWEQMQAGFRSRVDVTMWNLITVSNPPRPRFECLFFPWGGPRVRPLFEDVNPFLNVCVHSTTGLAHYRQAQGSSGNGFAGCEFKR